MLKRSPRYSKQDRQTFIKQNYHLSTVYFLKHIFTASAGTSPTKARNHRCFFFFFFSHLFRFRSGGQHCIYIIELSIWTARREVFGWVLMISPEGRPSEGWMLPGNVRDRGTEVNK